MNFEHFTKTDGPQPGFAGSAESRVSLQWFAFKDGGQCALILLDDAPSRNSMDSLMAAQFKETVGLVASVPGVRCTVLSGAGGLFSSGGNFDMLQSFAGMNEAEARTTMLNFYKSFLSIRSLAHPVIAAVNGHAIGAALCLVSACDLRIMSSNSRYAFNFVRIGLHPGMGATFLAPRLLGESRARRLLFCGETFTGSEAAQWGLATAAVDSGGVLAAAFERAVDICSAGPAALRRLKATMSDDAGLEEALLAESAAQAADYQGRDFAGAIESIRSKRAPIFHDAG